MTREVLRDHAREETHGVGLLITRLQGMFAKVSVHACTVFSSQRTSALSFYEVIFGNLCCLPLLKENVVGGLSQLALYQCGLHVSRHIKMCFFYSALSAGTVEEDDNVGSEKGGAQEEDASLSETDTDEDYQKSTQVNTIYWCGG